MSFDGGNNVMQQKRKVMKSNKEVAELQTKYKALLHSGMASKKNICELVIPIRNKYGISDVQALNIASGTMLPTWIDKLLTESILKRTEDVIPYRIVHRNVTMNFWWYTYPDNNVMIAMQVDEYDFNKRVVFSLAKLKHGYSAFKWVEEFMTVDADTYREIKMNILNKVLTNMEYSLS